MKGERLLVHVPYRTVLYRIVVPAVLCRHILRVPPSCPTHTGGRWGGTQQKRPLDCPWSIAGTDFETRLWGKTLRQLI